MKKMILGLAAAALLTSATLMGQSEFSSNLIGIGVVCDDLDASMDFYQKVIGMQKVGEFDVPEAFSKSSGLADGLPFHVNILKLEDSPDGNVWKLMSFGKERKHDKSTFIQDDMGMQYITINVTSLQPFIKRIKKQGVKFLGETPVAMSDGERHFVLVQAPEGTIIELIGPLE